MLTVGSSTLSAGSASGAAGSQMVSEISGRSSPVSATMSPASAASTSTRSSPRERSTCSTLALRRRPSRSRTTTGMFARTRPRVIRPMAMAPT